MKKFTTKILAAVSSVLIGVLSSSSFTYASDMLRMYNPNSGEHFYTANTYEADFLLDEGWSFEGIGWYAPDSGDPVYRLYNPNTGDHHYTLNGFERDMLTSVGWNYEGIGWYSAPSTEIPLYRAYNPNATGAGSHNYTVNGNEQNNLVSLGWRDEGVAWYGTSPINLTPEGDNVYYQYSTNNAVITNGQYEYASNLDGTYDLHIYYTITRKGNTYDYLFYTVKLISDKGVLVDTSFKSAGNLGINQSTSEEIDVYNVPAGSYTVQFLNN